MSIEAYCPRCKDVVPRGRGVTHDGESWHGGCYRAQREAAPCVACKGRRLMPMAQWGERPCGRCSGSGVEPARGGA